jgi:hypothetical protein
MSSQQNNIIEWAKKIGQNYNLKVTDVTKSFKDGKVKN